MIFIGDVGMVDTCHCTVDDTSFCSSINHFLLKLKYIEIKINVSTNVQCATKPVKKHPNLNEI